METTAPNESNPQVAGNAHDTLPMASATDTAPSRIVHGTADRLHRAATALRERAGAGESGRLTRAAGGAAKAIDQAASYVETASFSGLRQDLGGVIRRYPLQSLVVGLGIGFMAARLIRR